MKKSDQIDQMEVSDSGFSEEVSKNSDGNSMRYFIEKYRLSSKDAARVRNVIYPIVKNSIIAMVDDFYVWLEPQPVFRNFFGGNKALVKRVRNEQEKYWNDILSNKLDNVFYDKRVSLAETHARINLPLDSYFAGLAYFMNWVISKIEGEVAKGKKIEIAENEELLKATGSFIKLLQIDQAIVVDNYVRSTNTKLNELVQRQASTITKLATPIALLAKDILLVSVIGLIDSKRAQEIMETTLTKIVDTTSKVAIIDIAGVDMVDTAVANHLIKMTQAIKLMGCKCILSGVSPAIAQTVIQLGVDLKDLTTKAVLKDAVDMAIRLVDNETRNSLSLGS